MDLTNIYRQYLLQNGEKDSVEYITIPIRPCHVISIPYSWYYFIYCGEENNYCSYLDIKNETSYTMSITLVLRNSHTLELQCDKSVFVIDDISYMFTTQTLAQQVNLLIEKQPESSFKKAV